MNYLMLVNKNNLLDRTYIPSNLVNSESIYKDNIMIYQKAFRMFKIMKYFASRNGYNIDIMSGYRSYDYQDKIYNKLVNQKGFNYAFRYIATAGASEHQSGLAIDICIYRDNKCYIEHEIADFKEIKWLHKNAHKFGFILRYKLNKEDITGYIYEPWHLRYLGEDLAKDVYESGLTYEEYLMEGGVIDAITE